MIRFRLSELISDAQFKSDRRITLKEISEKTGINRMTLSRMSNLRGYSTSTETIDKLCRFFGCDVADVARYVEVQDNEVHTEQVATKKKGTAGTSASDAVSNVARARKKG